MQGYASEGRVIREALESEDATEIRTKTETLQTAFHAVSQAMYERAQQEQAAAAGPDGAGPNGDGTEASSEDDEEEVVDAEVVDEGKS